MSVFWAPVALVVKSSPANAGDIKDAGSIPELGKSPEGGHRHPTLVFLPEESLGQRSLAGCSPYSHKEVDTTETI